MCRSRERDSFNICMYDVYVQLLYANEVALRDVGVAWRTESAPREAYDLHILKFACQQQQHKRGTLKGEEKLVGRGRGERGCGCSWVAEAWAVAFEADTRIPNLHAHSAGDKHH